MLVPRALVMAPAGTPQPIVARLNAAIRDFATAIEVEKQMTGMGMMPIATPEPAALSTYLKSEIERWSKLVRAAGIAGSQ